MNRHRFSSLRKTYLQSPAFFHARRTITAACLTGLALLTVMLQSCTDEEKVQPINYNHKLHIETASLNCTDCHVSARTGIHASIPLTETCSSCHAEEPLTESAEEKKLLAHVSEGTEVPWKKVYAVPDHVYFSHRRHVEGGELECQECHGDVASFTTAVSRTSRPVTMENCMNCHREKNVTNDCLSCHR